MFHRITRALIVLLSSALFPSERGRFLEGPTCHYTSAKSILGPQRRAGWLNFQAN